MSLIPIMVRLDKKLVEDIESCMNMVLKDEDDITRFRMFEGSSKQDWYRILLRAGLDAKLQEFNRKKKEYHNES